MQTMYILQNGNTNQYKIGITKDLKTRLKDLQTGCPGILNIIKEWKHTQRKIIEKYERVLHNYYEREGKRIRTNGEWFELTESDIQVLCEPVDTKSQNKLIEKILKTF